MSSSSNWFLVELEFKNVGFWGHRKTGKLGEKPLGAGENQWQTQPTYGAGGGGGTLGISGWTRAILAEFCYPILEYTPQITPILE